MSSKRSIGNAEVGIDMTVVTIIIIVILSGLCERTEAERAMLFS